MKTNAVLSRLFEKPLLLCYGLCILALVLSLLLPRAKSSEAQACQIITETGKSVCGPFLTYWQTHGGVDVQGYPISDSFQEVSATDGQAYTVQYFEKAEFQLTPNNGVALQPLGALRFAQLYPNGAPTSAWDHANRSLFFPQTGLYVEEPFLTYWQDHGADELFGNPISKPFWERSVTNGQSYVVQYFERVELELHPEIAQSRYQVQPSHLGALRFAQLYPNGAP